jgi:hypothetical protein
MLVLRHGSFHTEIHGMHDGLVRRTGLLVNKYKIPVYIHSNKAKPEMSIQLARLLLALLFFSMAISLLSFFTSHSFHTPHSSSFSQIPFCKDRATLLEALSGGSRHAYNEPYVGAGVLHTEK